jgi:SNF2 family DNA or RNA helicase
MPAPAKRLWQGLLIRELKLRGLAERILIACPSNLTFQWQRELKEKFDEKFLVMKGTTSAISLVSTSGWNKNR